MASGYANGAGVAKTKFDSGNGGANYRKDGTLNSLLLSTPPSTGVTAPTARTADARRAHTARRVAVPPLRDEASRDVLEV
jgi:hypothetical protein